MCSVEMNRQSRVFSCDTDFDFEEDLNLVCSSGIRTYEMAPRFIADLKSTPSTGNLTNEVKRQKPIQVTCRKTPDIGSNRLHDKIDRSSFNRQETSQSRIIYRTNLPTLCGLQKETESVKSLGPPLPKWMLDSDIDIRSPLTKGESLSRNSVKVHEERVNGHNIFSSPKLKTFMDFAELRTLQEKANKTKNEEITAFNDTTIKKIDFSYNSFKRLVLQKRTSPKNLKSALKKGEAVKACQEIPERRISGKTTPKVSFSPSCMVLHYKPDLEPDESACFSNFSRS